MEISLDVYFGHQCKNSYWTAFTKAVLWNIALIWVAHPIVIIIHSLIRSVIMKNSMTCILSVWPPLWQKCILNKLNKRHNTQTVLKKNLFRDPPTQPFTQSTKLGLKKHKKLHHAGGQSCKFLQELDSLIFPHSVTRTYLFQMLHLFRRKEVFSQ